MKHDKQKHNWLIDAVLFGGFLGALWLDLTGVAAHQWLGLAVGGLATYHLVRHWSWVKAVTARFFGRTSTQLRTFYAVDAALAVGLATITVTGVVISTWLDLTLATYAAWHTVHVAASVATLALLVAKIGLHWRWIIDVARRRIFSAPASAQAPTQAGQPGLAQPVRVVRQTPLGRRDFVRLMAGVGAVALLAGANALSVLKIGDAEASAAASSAGDDLAQTAASAQAQACTVRCSQGCSYPGRCGRYVDSNDNGLCDLGECITISGSTASAATAAQATTVEANRSASSGYTTSTCSVRCGRRCSYPGHCRRYTDSNGNGRCDLRECLS
jgi:hypothetical protein